MSSLFIFTCAPAQSDNRELFCADGKRQTDYAKLEFSFKSTGSQPVDEEYTRFQLNGANPVNPYTTLQITSTKNSDVSLYITNTSGVVLSQQNYTINAGTTQLSIPALEVPSGVYYLSVLSEGKKETYRLVKL